MEPYEETGLVAAKAAMQRAHAPYSGFHVGAAIVMADGEVFGGCNVESASYGLTLCAERSGLSAAIAARGSLGPSSVAFVVIATEADTPTPPRASVARSVDCVVGESRSKITVESASPGTSAIGLVLGGEDPAYAHAEQTSTRLPPGAAPIPGPLLAFITLW